MAPTGVSNRDRTDLPGCKRCSYPTASKSGYCGQSPECKNLSTRYYASKGRPTPEPHSVAKLTTRQSNWQLRLDVIAGYGAQCACCGETNPKCLVLDHVHGDGLRERESVSSTIELYALVKAAGYPDRYQVLCTYCNGSKGDRTDYTCGCRSVLDLPMRGQLTLF